MPHGPLTPLGAYFWLLVRGGRWSHNAELGRTTISVGGISATNQNGVYPDCLPGLIPLLEHKLAMPVPMN
jgi:hypothetical protein